ncbi:MAG: TIGR03790 family protein [Methylibium sp.]|nr:TIGR03790 family protein [Methylibium sp.]
MPGLVAPRDRGRLRASELGLVINIADSYSVQVGEFYAQARRLAPAQVLRVVLPVRRALDAAEFESLAAQIDAHFGEDIQALALAWNQPYAVGCQSITGALALGLDAGLCERSCAPTEASPYFNSASLRPWGELRMRPSMLLAAADVRGARALIERGIAADGSLGWRGAPPVQAHFVFTGDALRSVRSRLYPPPAFLRRFGVDVRVGSDDAAQRPGRVLLYLTGLAQVSDLDRLEFVPGALADHMTSFGGQLDGSSTQTSARAWLDAGATASYGTVSEPCNHVQKFPHPQVLLRHYLQGSTALEAYWRSVAWPSQGVFIGEPLAAPFARP